MIRTVAFTAFTLLAGLPASAATGSYDPATNYIDQFSEQKVHLLTQDRSTASPAEDYVDALRSTFRAQERRAGEPDDWDQGQSNRLN